MRILTALLVVVTLAGCAGQQMARVEPRPAEPVMHFELDIPRQFQSELRGWTNDLAGCQRYMSGFERGWWRCVENYLKDIGYESKPSDAYGIGWNEAVCGWSAGYRNADRQIQWNIKAFGPGRTHAYLVEITADVIDEP